VRWLVDPQVLAPKTPWKRIPYLLQEAVVLALVEVVEVLEEEPRQVVVGNRLQVPLLVTLPWSGLTLLLAAA
jgi:hypothetical protein